MAGLFVRLLGRWTAAEDSQHFRISSDILCLFFKQSEISESVNVICVEDKRTITDTRFEAL